MSVVPLLLQIVAIVCLFLAAFSVKVPHVDAIGWFGLALFVIASALPILRA